MHDILLGSKIIKQNRNSKFIICSTVFQIVSCKILKLGCLQNLKVEYQKLEIN